MNTMIGALSAAILASTLNLYNPLKMSLILLVFSAIMFIYLSISGSSVWLPLIFFLLFMGGILVLFMLISSVLPNEKMKKASNLSKVLILSAMYGATFINQTPSSSNCSTSLKATLEAGTSLVWVVALIIMYFLVVVYMLCKSKNPLRSFMCL